MTGGFFDLGRMPLAIVAMAGACVLLASIACICSLRIWQRLPAHVAFLAFLLLSVAMAARGRIGWGAAYMVQDRYRLYGLLALSVLFLLALEFTPSARRRTAAIVALFATAAFCFLSYASCLEPMATASRWCEATALNGQLGSESLLSGGPDLAEARAALDRAQKLNVYHLPRLLSAEDISLLSSLPAQPVATPERRFRAHPNASIFGATLDPETPASTTAMPAFALVVTSTHRLVLPMDVKHPSLVRIPNRWSLFGSEFRFIWPLAAGYETGEHALYGLRRESSGQLIMLWSAVAICPPIAIFP
jgi:hypothetical protein